ncbi:MAG TPA: PqqD family protein [Chitinophagaceae bacterium]|nr:PqqD family protein [Chitinophagaceae bacterium]HRF18616.1 PqqD family protein [Chitinophagaceae bacterium]
MYLKKNIATSESGFIFNPSTGDSYAANQVATDILQLLKQGTALSLVKEQLLEKYRVDPLRLEQDWDDFINQLKQANLLES